MSTSPLESRAEPITPEQAQALAEEVHRGTLDRYGVPLLDHVRRVAEAAPPEAATVAWLHEFFESTDLSARQLAQAGVSPIEVQAIELLTRLPVPSAGDYDAHVMGIATAPGRAGDLARIVKHIDLHDRIAHQVAGGSDAPAHPPYQRALQLLDEFGARAASAG